MTITTEPRLIVPGDADRALWMEERGEGVTASHIWAIARGSMAAWSTYAKGQMNGSPFGGSADTRAGSAREPAILDEATEFDPTIRPNAGLWGAATNDLHRATPDGIGDTVVVEVKSHKYGWDSEAIPLDHLGQMQWQIHVLGKAGAWYGFEVRDEDDQPPAEGATWIYVPRDDEMISWLVSRADEYIAWREAGCPAFMPLPDELAAANDAWVAAKKALDAAAAIEKPANAALKKLAAAQPHAKYGLVGMGEHGGFQITPSTRTTIDIAAWRKNDPDGFARAESLREALETAEDLALAAYPKTTTTTTMRFQEPTDV